MKKQEGNKLRGSAGFTLVELIVVIAIIGILAGVGTVGYSGYVKKANQAADNMLLGAVNTSFAAACMENGFDAVKASDARLDFGTDGKTLNGLEVVYYNGGAVDAARDSFAKYFNGSNGSSESTFKYLDGSDIQFVNGVFTADPDAIMGKVVNNYRDSTYFGNEEDLMQSVDNLTNVFSDWLGDGTAPIDTRLAQLSALQLDAEEITAFKEKYNLNEGSSNTAIANALVLEVASRTKNADVQGLYNKLCEDGPTALLDGDYMTNLPFAYGIVTAYAKSTYASPEFKDYYSNATLSAGLNDNDDGNKDSLMTLLQKFGSDPEKGGNINGYFAERGLDDMYGYVGAMTAVDLNSGSVDINAEKAFNNTEILALVQNLLGSGN